MDQNRNSGRRGFLKTAVAGTAAVAFNPRIKSVFGSSESASRSPLNKWPGRVAINFNKGAVKNGEADVAVNIEMIDETIKLLTGEETVGKAWKAIFPDSLSPISKIAVKVVAYNPFKSGLHWSCAKAVTDGLQQMDFDGTPFPAENITIYEMTTAPTANAFTIAGYIPENFPGGVNISTVKNPVDGGDGALNNRQYSSVLKEADFLINCFNARGHMLGDSDGKFTLGFKSHFGSYHDPWGMHDSNGGVSKNIRELVCTGPVYKKQVLCVCASPFGSNEGNGPGGISGDDLPPDDFSTYVNQIDDTADTTHPSTVLMSTDAVAAEMQAIKIIRMNQGGKYGPSDLPAYVQSAAGVDKSGFSPTYNIGIHDESKMDIYRIINGEIINAPPVSIGSSGRPSRYASAHHLSVRPTAGGGAYLEYRLPADFIGKQATLTIHDVRGSVVRVFSPMVTGILNHLSWNGYGNNGRRIARGRYIARLSCGRVSKSVQFSLIH